jgi:DNA invertase Pin-like site-specific DNA recombinase
MSKKRVLAGVYCRISRDASGEMLGVDRQRADCEGLVERLGWASGGVYVDDDVSAFSGRRRPGYEELLRDLRSGRLGAVVAWHPDRLHRSPREVEVFIDVVNAAGARVATVQAGEYDLSTASGRMTARVVGAVARHESEQKSDRLRRQRVETARSGHPNGGPRPFGYESDGIAVRPREAAVVQEAARRVLAGESVRSVALDLNRREILTTFGNRWTVTSLRLMLLRPRYAGLRVHRGAVVGDAVWSGLLTRADHAELCRRLAAKPRTVPGRRSLLSGLLRCGRCGGPMGHQVRDGNHRRYYCVPEPASRGCGRVAIHAEPTEQHLCELMLERHDTALLAEVVRAAAGVTLFDDEAAIRTRLGSLADLYADGAITEAEWLRARGRLEDRMIGGPVARPHITAALQLGASTSPGLLRIVWQQLKVEQRRRIMLAAVETISVAPAPKSGGRFNERRLTITWRTG